VLYWLGLQLTELYGPFRLLRSHAILIIIGLYLGFAATFALLPRVRQLLPSDQGRAHAAQADGAVGKPTGAGVVFISVFVAVALLLVPPGRAQLAMLGLISLGVIMYFVVGHAAVSDYLLLPHNSAGAKWAIMTFTMVGCLAAYLWYNAYPSRVLMGDAGSRALGFFVGVSVMNSGNPFLIFIIASVLLVNGGAGLVKVALLRFLKIRVLHNTRFPLHDHLRESRSWSNAQVLVKFAIIQLLITFGLFGAFLKIR